MAVLKIDDVGFSIKERVLFDGLSVELYPGEKVAVIGEVGSGRSDLLNLITGLASPDSGRIQIFGIDINRIGPHEKDGIRKRMGVVSQMAALVSNLKVIQNVTLPLLYHSSMTSEEILKHGAELLKRVGYNENIWVLPGLLPVFKKKAVSLARAMALDPEIMIYDRFLEGLDSRQREFMAGLTAQVHNSRGNRLSIFLANDMEEIGGLCMDRIFKISERTLAEV